MHVEGCNQVWAGDLSCETKALVRKVNPPFGAGSRDGVLDGVFGRLFKKGLKWSQLVVLLLRDELGLDAALRTLFFFNISLAVYCIYWCFF